MAPKKYRKIRFGKVRVMIARLKQYLFIAILVAAGYFLLSHHIIFNGKQVYLLDKSALHLHYTFYSLSKKKPEVILKIDTLRQDGIGDLLVKLGKITEDEKMRLESKFEYGY
jgi:hypothetical protein